MKKILNILITFVAAIFFTACSDNETLIPTEVETMSRFDFPEGTEDYDKIFEKIYEKHGVQIIYKNWTKKDWEKSWKDPGLTGISTVYNGNHPTNGVVDTLTILAEFMRDDIFTHISTELSKKTFRPYIYLVNGYSGTMFFGTFSITSYINRGEYRGLDNLIWSPYTPDNPGLLSGDATRKHVLRCLFIWCDVLEDALEKNIIDNIPDLRAGLDLTTTIVTTTGADADVNYYLNRGFPDIVGRLFGGSISKPLLTNYSSASGNKTLLEHYIRLAMYYDEATINAKYGSYPKVIERYNMVTEHMMNVYNVDLKGIARR